MAEGFTRSKPPPHTQQCCAHQIFGSVPAAPARPFELACARRRFRGGGLKKKGNKWLDAQHSQQFKDSTTYQPLPTRQQEECSLPLRPTRTAAACGSSH